VEAPDIRGQWNANAAAWTEMSRAGFDRYRDLVNTPGFFALLPAVDGLTCLDLGCGEGHNTRLLAGRGARVIAVDIAESFIAAAAGIPHQGIRYLVGDGALLPFRAASFDAVTAFMSLMDVADPERTLREVARVLRPGGFVQFSVLHPIMSAPVGHWSRTRPGRARRAPSASTSTRARSPRPGPSARRRPSSVTGTSRSRSPTRAGPSPGGWTPC